jgi:hypothetical protein
MLQAKHILPDTLISRLEARCFDIKSPADVAPALSPRANLKDISKHTRVADDTSKAELAELILQVVDKATDPQPAPRPRGQPFKPGDAKPLYSSDDIAAAINPVVSQMMETANSLLRQFDLTAVNAKETARKKRSSRLQMMSASQASGMAASQASGMAASQASDISGTESVAASICSEMTDRDLMPPPPVPGKRPRGRPRGSKNKVRASSVGASSVASDKSSVHSLGSGSSDILQPPSKKRRGRPPGSKNKPKINPPADENGDENRDDNEDKAGDNAGDTAGEASGDPVPADSSNGASEPLETPKTRRRGRPLGSKNKPKDPPPDQPQDAMHPLTRTPHAPKRGPGRPRGSKNRSSSNAPDVSEA